MFSWWIFRHFYTYENKIGKKKTIKKTDLLEDIKMLQVNYIMIKDTYFQTLFQGEQYLFIFLTKIINDENI